MIRALLIAGAIAFSPTAVNPSPTPTDTPTTTIDSTQMAVFLASGNPAVGTACQSYNDLSGTMASFIAIAGGDSQTLDIFTEVMDDYLIVTVEGDSLRLTPEARDVFVTWLHADCSA